MTIHEELAEERNWLERLTSGALTLRRNHRDVTQYEIGVAKRTIAFLEKVLARGSDRPPT
jgi:hypothetical protein